VLDVSKRKQERDGDRFRREGAHGGGDARDLAVRQLLDRSIRPHALRDSDDVRSRDERSGMIARQIVQRRPILPP